MKSILTTLAKGSQGELIAEEYLLNKGFFLLERNWRFKNHLEVDRIFLVSQQILVAVEVRSFQSEQPISPFETIDHPKISRLKRALLQYSMLNYDQFPPMRIDVVSVVVEPRKIEHFESVDLQ